MPPNSLAASTVQQRQGRGRPPPATGPRRATPGGDHDNGGAGRAGRGRGRQQPRRGGAYNYSPGPPRRISRRARRGPPCRILAVPLRYPAFRRDSCLSPARVRLSLNRDVLLGQAGQTALSPCIAVAEVVAGARRRRGSRFQDRRVEDSGPERAGRAPSRPARPPRRRRGGEALARAPRAAGQAPPALRRRSVLQ